MEIAPLIYKLTALLAGSMFMMFLCLLIIICGLIVLVTFIFKQHKRCPLCNCFIPKGATVCPKCTRDIGEKPEED